MFGFKRVNPGGMSEYMVYPVEALVHKVSKDIRVNEVDRGRCLSALPWW
jgi:hypothetical protein